jgi:hypothetical protein
MIGRARNDRIALDRLADALVEDILAAPDAEILAEAEGSDEDGAEIAHTAFNVAVAASEKRRSRPVHRRTAHLPWTWTDVRALDPKAARRWREDFIALDPKAVRTAFRRGCLWSAGEAPGAQGLGATAGQALRGRAR